jgi:hypothetical protein
LTAHVAVLYQSSLGCYFASLAKRCASATIHRLTPQKTWLVIKTSLSKSNITLSAAIMIFFYETIFI